VQRDNPKLNYRLYGLNVNKDQENEKLKYTANFMSSLATTVVGAGTLAPIVAIALEKPDDKASAIGLAVIVLASVFCGAILYWQGLRTLDDWF
jgi:hypothetical protein